MASAQRTAGALERQPSGPRKVGAILEGLSAHAETGTPASSVPDSPTRSWFDMPACIRYNGAWMFK